MKKLVFLALFFLVAARSGFVAAATFKNCYDEEYCVSANNSCSADCGQNYEPAPANDGPKTCNVSPAEDDGAIGDVNRIECKWQ